MQTGSSCLDLWLDSSENQLLIQPKFGWMSSWFPGLIWQGVSDDPNFLKYKLPDRVQGEHRRTSHQRGSTDREPQSTCLVGWFCCIQFPIWYDICLLGGISLSFMRNFDSFKSESVWLGQVPVTDSTCCCCEPVHLARGLPLVNSWSVGASQWGKQPYYRPAKD